jgi:integrase/recombinase XerD
MDMGQTKQMRYETKRESIQTAEGITTTDSGLILEYLDAADPDHLTSSLPSGKTKAPGTLDQHANSLLRVAKDLHSEGDSLAECSTRDLNSLMSRYLKGDVDSCKDSGLSNGTVNNRQGPLRVFYRFHNNLGVEPDALTMMDIGDTSVDENDMFSKEEVHQMREVAKTSGTRDICLLDLLIYTGQRISAILNLRLKDVDAHTGTFTLNEEAGDLKGASGKRPLLGAQKSVRDWKRQHPTGEPEDYLITCKISQASRDDVTAGDRISSAGVHRVLNRIGDKAEVDKPVNAHNFRHYFVTSCKKDYNMDNDTIKHLLGHEPGSTVMEETYSHLTDEDYIQDAEEDFGIREPEEESPLTPPVCDQCGEPLEGDWEACPYCGMNYSPASQQTKEQIQDSMWEEKSEAETGSKTEDSVDELRELLKEKPEILEELTN